MMFQFMVPAILVAMLAGCGSIGAIGFPPAQRGAAEKGDSVVISPVESLALPPVIGSAPPSSTGIVGAAAPGTTNPGAVSGPTAPGFVPDGGTVTSTAAAPASAEALGRTDLLGGWTVASDGDTCQLFMTLTSWTGGYRASTRGCNSEVLKSISAWNINGKQVVLAGSGGSSVASLIAAGNGRFNGQTDRGSQIIFYR